MPQPVQQRDARSAAKAERERLRLAAMRDFRDGFKRSKRGNLWRNFRGLTLTVFRRAGDNWFAWSIADEEGPRYSPHAWETEEEAIGALWLLWHY